MPYKETKVEKRGKAVAKKSNQGQQSTTSTQKTKQDEFITGK